MNGFIVGPQIRPLHQWAEYDSTAITIYISTVLNQMQKQDSYDILASVQVGKGPLVATLIFGFPGEPVPEAAVFPTVQSVLLRGRTGRTTTHSPSFLGCKDGLLPGR